MYKYLISTIFFNKILGIFALMYILLAPAMVILNKYTYFLTNPFMLNIVTFTASTISSLIYTYCIYYFIRNKYDNHLKISKNQYFILKIAPTLTYLLLFVVCVSISVVSYMFVINEELITYITRLLVNVLIFITLHGVFLPKDYSRWSYYLNNIKPV